MGKVVGIFGSTHNPLLWRALQGDVAPDLLATRDRFHEMRERITELRPDTIVVVGTDHLSQWFYDNMPTFLVGKSELIPATFHNEEREFGIPTDVVAGDAALGRDLLTGGIRAGIDFASSDQFRADHSIYLPYAFLRPDPDVALLPVFTNCIAPPFPGPERFYRLGEVLRQSIEQSPLDRRVVIVASGHLATEVGGPRQFRGCPDEEFDNDAVRWMRDGLVQEAFQQLTFDRMLAAGNVTAQFLNFMVSMGAAAGLPASSATGTPSRFASSPFFEWSPPEVPE